MQNAPLLALFAHQGFEEMVALLMDFGADVNGRNADGITPLMFACQRGRSEVSRTLVQHGAVVNAIDNDDKSALLYAAEYGHLEIVELLVACDWGHLTNELGLMEAAQQATVTAASKGHIQVRNLHFLSKNSTLISRENCRFFFRAKKSLKCCGFRLFSCRQL